MNRHFGVGHHDHFGGGTVCTELEVSYMFPCKCSTDLGTMVAFFTIAQLEAHFIWIKS